MESGGSLEALANVCFPPKADTDLTHMPFESQTSCAAARRATVRQPSAVSAYPRRSSGVTDRLTNASIEAARAKHSIDVSIGF